MGSPIEVFRRLLGPDFGLRKRLVLALESSRELLLYPGQLLVPFHDPARGLRLLLDVRRDLLPPGRRDPDALPFTFLDHLGVLQHIVKSLP